ncbi:hypothetical protein [Modestobacter caceresii]|uniref:hypothetical protein n=1 Tax=Modestobacter caceresii TaxID=1522368 RepID=UPI0012E00258|nr:hypothetical protein [Modestobacter caceresii]
MIERGRDYSWLPERHLGIASTLAHADDLIDRAGDALFGYLKPPGPLRLKNVSDERTSYVTVAEVGPLPAAASRYAADALTQLRAAIEHTLFAEVEHQLGRPLDAREAASIEMPAKEREADFSAWLRDRRRGQLAPLQEGAPLVQRMRELQPYQQHDAQTHPLRVLAEHTNRAKHRTPAVAATLLGAVMADVQHPQLMLADVGAAADEKPVKTGDVLASGPLSVEIPLTIWPKVSIQRPHTGTWHVFMTELGELEAWVRTIAVPTLAAGTHDVDPLPPQLDTTLGYEDVRAALITAGTVTARQRAWRRILAGTFRIALVQVLTPLLKRPDVNLEGWAESLTDEEALERHDRLFAAQHDSKRVESVLTGFVDEATAATDWKNG